MMGQRCFALLCFNSCSSLFRDVVDTAVVVFPITNSTESQCPLFLAFTSYLPDFNTMELLENATKTDEPSI